MVAVLRPRSRWWDDLLAMVGLDEAATPGDPVTAPPGMSSSAGVTSKDGRPPRTGERPDADLLGLEPAEQLAALTQRHADAVYRVAMSVTRDPDLAEDVAQDALLKAWQALPAYRGDAPLKNWLLRITHNTAISALRRRRDVHVDPSELPDDAPSAHLAPQASVEERVEDRVSFDAFEDALGQLDELSRSVVVLREVEGMSYDEIASVLDVPLPTVKTRLLRARRLLATALEGWRP
jgi:RNA polymerase sigma-70 factor (ECF subfamily)